MEEAPQISPEEKAKEELEKLISREKLVEDRVKKIRIFHEDIVIINRLGDGDTLTFLAVAEKTIKGHKQNSWYGKVLKVSKVDSADEVRNAKKAMLKEGDVISFNPESAYSLNITGFDEVWVMHIDNVLVVDEGYDYLKAIEENCKKRFELQNTIALIEAKKAAMANQQKGPRPVGPVRSNR